VKISWRIRWARNVTTHTHTHTCIWSENLKEKDSLENLRIYGRIIIKLILKKQEQVL